MGLDLLETGFDRVHVRLLSFWPSRSVAKAYSARIEILKRHHNVKQLRGPLTDGSQKGQADMSETAM